MYSYKKIKEKGLNIEDTLFFSESFKTQDRVLEEYIIFNKE